MLQINDRDQIITTWTNGRKAIVNLMADSKGEQYIQKLYRPGFTFSMIREYIITDYLSKRLDIVPKVLKFRPVQKQIYLSFMKGKRVLEWVLEHFGDDGVSIMDFQSVHGLETNQTIAVAFKRFRESNSTDATRLREAIKLSYVRLHKLKFVHGSTDPRNIIYDGNMVHIIDFDNSRPSLLPEKVDSGRLKMWYGI
jgi:tRNA A-37 threonylcarbamoyl transferase component Bud32